jgi:hypothetical protein
VQLYLRAPALFYCRHSSLLVTMPSMGRICVASSRQDVRGGNANLWVYTVILDDEATVLASETRLFFQDRKFSARGVPLRAENFAESKDFIRAAQAILGPHPPLGGKGEGAHGTCRAYRRRSAHIYAPQKMPGCSNSTVQGSVR